MSTPPHPQRKRGEVSNIDNGHKHLMNLIVRDRNITTGYAKVSAVVEPLVRAIPDGLVEIKPADDGCFVKLTAEGEAVVKWL